MASSRSTLFTLRSGQSGLGIYTTRRDAAFGQSRPAQLLDLGFPIHYTGRLHDDFSLRLLYSVADEFLIPSRQDNLPNTGLEAHACGTPVVGFRTGGLVDIVDDRVTGVLAEPFNPKSLAAAIGWVLEDFQRRLQLGNAARQRAERLWDPARVAGLYAQVYRQVLNPAASPILASSIHSHIDIHSLHGIS